MTSMNSSVYLAFFNGTPLQFPSVDELEIKKLESFIDESIKSYNNDTEFYLNQTKAIEQKIHELSKNNVLTKSIILETASQLGFDNELSLIIIWFCNIKYLLNKKIIKDDNNNGFQYIAADKKTLKKLTKHCEICGILSSKCCPTCKSAYYCCAEHQKQDWKIHKKYCQTIYSKSKKTNA